MAEGHRPRPMGLPITVAEGGEQCVLAGAGVGEGLRWEKGRGQIRRLVAAAHGYRVGQNGWGQSSDRLPGSGAGLSLSLLWSFEAPTGT